MSYCIQAKRKSDWKIFQEQGLFEEQIIKIVEKFRDDYLLVDGWIFKDYTEIEYIKIFDRNFEEKTEDGRYLEFVDYDDFGKPFLAEMNEEHALETDVTRVYFDKYFSLRTNKIKVIDIKMINSELTVNDTIVNLWDRAGKSKIFLRLLCDCFYELKQSEISISNLSDKYMEKWKEKIYEWLKTSDIDRLKIANGYIKTINKNITKQTGINNLFEIHVENIVQL